MNASKCFKYILLLFATKIIIIGIISFCANKVSTSILSYDDDREDAREKRFRSLFGLKSKGDINSSSRRLAKLAPQSSSPNPSSSCALPLPLIDTSLL